MAAADFILPELYPASHLSRTWDAYVGVTAALIELRTDLALSEAAQVEGKVKSYAGSMDTSVSGRDREASINTLDHTLDIINIKSEIQAREDLRQLLHTAIIQGVEIF